MNTSRLTALSVLAVALAVSSAAQADTLSRAQVKAELAEAQRTGALPDHELGSTLAEAFPRVYPGQAKAAALTVRTPEVRQSANTIGDIEYDAVARRGAEAIARRAPVASDAQVAGAR